MAEGRTPLPYWIFLVAGVLVTTVSLITIARTSIENNGMVLFAGAGGIFIIIGIIKFFTQRRKGLTGEERMVNRVMGVNIDKAVRTIERQHNRNFKQQRPVKRPPELIRCVRCGTLNYDHSNYCHMCGYVLQK